MKIFVICIKIQQKVLVQLINRHLFNKSSVYQLLSHGSLCTLTSPECSYQKQLIIISHPPVVLQDRRQNNLECIIYDHIVTQKHVPNQLSSLKSIGNVFWPTDLRFMSSNPVHAMAHVLCNNQVETLCLNDHSYGEHGSYLRRKR